MIIWFLFALGSAVSQSLYQAATNYSSSVGKFSKFVVIFWAALISSVILFSASYFIGFPTIQNGFWQTVFITAVLNFIAAPLMLKGYELGDFSSVYSMFLLSPVFTLLTGFIFVGEEPTFLGSLGVALTVLGLIIISRATNEKGEWRFNRGILLGMLVALIFSVSATFDKLSVLRADPFLAGAAIWGTVVALNGIYLLFAKSKEERNDSNVGISFQPIGYLVLIGSGIILGLNSIVYNFALSMGFVSHTIAIKRLGVLFGVIWAWLFFREKNISKKLLGAGVAIAGVILILFS